MLLNKLYIKKICNNNHADIIKTLVYFYMLFAYYYLL